MTQPKESDGKVDVSQPSAQTTADLPLWDQAAALAATGGDAQLARELLDALIESLPEQLSALRDLWTAGDWRGIDDTVHRMRGATAYTAVPALDVALVELKDAAKAADTAKIAEGLRRVNREASRLRAENR